MSDRRVTAGVGILESNPALLARQIRYKSRMGIAVKS